MTPPKIQTKTPLTTEYLEQKKLVEQNRKTAISKKAAGMDSTTEDAVSLSSTQPDSPPPLAKMKPSQPVTFEERQALNAQFSIRA